MLPLSGAFGSRESHMRLRLLSNSRCIKTKVVEMSGVVVPNAHIKKSREMDVYAIILRLVHILAGVLWAGWAFVSVAFIEPATRAAGPEGGKFMQALTGKTKLLQTMLAAPLLVIITGVLMYWQESGGLSSSWLVSPPGLALTISSLAGILAFVLGLAINRPAAERLAGLSRAMQSAGGPPSSEQMAELRAQQRRLSMGGLYGALLLAIAVIGMALAGALG